MDIDQNWNRHQGDPEEDLREINRAVDLAHNVVWVIIIGTFLMFLLVVAITFYCYKKKRVTPGFVIRPAPGNGYTTLEADYATGVLGYPTGAPGYPTNTAAYPSAAYPPVYPSGAPGYPNGAPDYPTGAPGYPTEKPAQPPPYSSGNFTQS